MRRFGTWRQLFNFNFAGPCFARRMDAVRTDRTSRSFNSGSRCFGLRGLGAGVEGFVTRRKYSETDDSE